MTERRPVVIGADSSLTILRDVFRRGGIIVYPTETFYGIGVDPFNPEALKKAFALKGRDHTSPFPVIVRDMAMLMDMVEELPPVARRLMERFWPGPLTLVLKGRSTLPPLLTAGTGRVGVRISSSDVARRIVEEIGSPITATSANPSGMEPAVNAEKVVEYFPTGVDMVVDGGHLHGKKGSTVVDVREDRITLIREGEIPFSELADH